ARAAFPEFCDDALAEMQEHRECLIHADLWSKNLLVAKGKPLAVVDFEGVCLGDPAFDLGTLIAVALLPALDNRALLDNATTFCAQLLGAWTNACGSDRWSAEVLPRTFRATATFLAARGFGPFAYVMSDAARERVRILATSLAANPPATLPDFIDRVVHIE
ncbi:MAG TPA: phosphotransferase, partial [Thermoanaerobaculia bacterium]|nr:phosphotransferase [Thermoanaerobaculia bacterium]